VYIFCKIFP